MDSFKDIINPENKQISITFYTFSIQKNEEIYFKIMDIFSSCFEEYPPYPLNCQTVLPFNKETSKEKINTVKEFIKSIDPNVIFEKDLEAYTEDIPY